MLGHGPRLDALSTSEIDSPSDAVGPTSKQWTILGRTSRAANISGFTFSLSALRFSISEPYDSGATAAPSLCPSTGGSDIGSGALSE